MEFVPFILALSLAVLCVLFWLERRTSSKLRKEALERNMMIALVSHRLRTPLSSVKWHTEMLLNQEFGKLQISQMELLDKVNTGIADAINVLNTFLEVSRVERGEGASTPVMLDLHQHIQNVLNIHKDTVFTKHLHIICPKPQQRITVFADPLILHMVLDVLIHNAITYSPDGRTIHIDAEDKGTDVQLQVTDSGMGIPVFEQTHIFTKFFRGSDAKRMATNGNGLGLYLTKTMLENAGGSIYFTSREGKGTTFTVRLPKK